MVYDSKKYVLVEPERYKQITNNYKQFLNGLNDVSVEPVKVFNPLSQKVVDELLLIREVSKNLQKKKEEDMQKQAAKEAEELVMKKDEEVIEEKKDE